MELSSGYYFHKIQQLINACILFIIKFFDNFWVFDRESQ